MTTSNLELTRAFLRSLETRDGSTLAFYATQVVQRELPNRLTPGGATRDLAALRESGERGKQVVSEERYEIVNLVGSGAEVAAEVVWTARLKVSVGALPAGAIMKAHLAMFITWQNSKIISQRNYDCFEPF